jgi:hypothetical protein
MQMIELVDTSTHRICSGWYNKKGCNTLKDEHGDRSRSWYPFTISSSVDLDDISRGKPWQNNCMIDGKMVDRAAVYRPVQIVSMLVNNFSDEYEWRKMF